MASWRIWVLISSVRGFEEFGLLDRSEDVELFKVMFRFSVDVDWDLFSVSNENPEEFFRLCKL